MDMNVTMTETKIIPLEDVSNLLVGGLFPPLNIDDALILLICDLHTSINAHSHIVFIFHYHHLDIFKNSSQVCGLISCLLFCTGDIFWRRI